MTQCVSPKIIASPSRMTATGTSGFGVARGPFKRNPRKVSKAIKERSARNSESEVNSNRSVSLGRQGRLDYVNFGTYVPRI